jgi:hypothetical protein
MAGDWIKTEKATPRKPEVLRLAIKLGIHPDHAFGLCFRFWCWCDDNLDSCNAVGVTEVMLDALLERDGIATALVEVGWLQVRNGSLVIPNFDRHLSESAKKRGLSAKRTADSRSRKSNAANVTEVLPEKRREEKNIREREVHAERKFSPEFEEAWKRWRQHSADKGKPINSMSEETQLIQLFQAYPKESEAIKAIMHAIAKNWANVNLRNDHNRVEEPVKVSFGGRKTTGQQIAEDLDKAFGGAK